VTEVDAKRTTNRQDALERGDRKYHGRPCRNGHTERYTSSGKCVACEPAEARVRQSAYMKLKHMTYRGAPCRQGHTERYVGNRKCVECTRLTYERQRERVTEARRQTDREGGEPDATAVTSIS
jgi:hypothetical protein